MKKVPFEMIAVLVAATLVCITIVLLALNMNAEQVVQETPVVTYVPHYSTGQTYTIGTDAPEEPAEKESDGPTDDEQQVMNNAEYTILELSEQIGDLEEQLNDIEDDIDDEEDADDIEDDIHDVEEQAEDILYSISKWNNYLIDIEEADSLRDDLYFLQTQADDVLDDCSDLEEDAEDLDS